MLPENSWFTIDEVAKRWGITEKKVEHYLMAGQLKAMVILRKMQVNEKVVGGYCEIADYIEFSEFMRNPIDTYLSFIQDGELQEIHGSYVLHFGGVMEDSPVIAYEEAIRFENTYNITPNDIDNGITHLEPYRDINHPHYSKELDAAIIAWEYAVSKNPPKSNFKALLEERLARFPDLEKGTAERIATVANPHKKTGPRKRISPKIK